MCVIHVGNARRCAIHKTCHVILQYKTNCKSYSMVLMCFLYLLRVSLFGYQHFFILVRDYYIRVPQHYTSYSRTNNTIHNFFVQFFKVLSLLQDFHLSFYRHLFVPPEPMLQNLGHGHIIVWIGSSNMQDLP